MNIKSLLIVCFIFLVACAGPDGSAPPESTDSTTDDSTGTGTDWHKEIEFSMQEPNSDYLIGPALLVRKDAGSASYELIIPVTNISSSTRCYIRMNNAVFYYTNGDSFSIHEDSFYIEGIIKQLMADGSITYGNFCLDPSQTGYVLETYYNSDLEFDDIASMSIRNLSDESEGYLDPNQGLTIITQTYSQSRADVTIQNTGTAPINAYITYVLLDHNGDPLFYDNLDYDGKSTVRVNAGQLITISDTPDFSRPIGGGTAFLDWDWVEDSPYPASNTTQKRK